MLVRYFCACVSHFGKSLPHCIAECLPALHIFTCAAAYPISRWGQIGRLFESFGTAMEVFGAAESHRAPYFFCISHVVRLCAK